RDMREEELTSIAEKMREDVFDEGQDVFKEGAVADRFYIISRGRVQITQMRGKEKVSLAWLVGGDYFGEEALYANRRRSATVTAVERDSLFSLSRDEFNEIIKRFPKLKSAFEVSIASRRLARQLRFKWLWSDEVVYFVARKHVILLARALTGPVLALVIPLGLLIAFFTLRSLIANVLAGASFFAILFWGIWNAIDWSNDYYIVTNQRAIWLEKVIGLYDSRQEAPLSTILSVSVETDMTGRLLDYGNVVVRTFVGRLPFSHVSHPYQAAQMIEEQWARTKHFASRAEKEAMRDTIRMKLGLKVEEKTQETKPPEKPISIRVPYRPSWWRLLFANWFKLRTEDSGTITYHKHWYVLLRQTLQPTLIILLALGGIAARVYTLWQTPGAKLYDFTNGIQVDLVAIFLVAALIPLIGWWIYQYIDWSNDIFQVTPDQILDLDRKPFGTEERRAAPLENILSMEYKRLGLIGYLFNFGTVEISVGGTKLAFEDVLDPAAVQADIDRRRAARIAKKREAEANAERERMADWLASYHENAKELYQEEEQKEQEQPKVEPKSE
ncbi:MAG TPA: cyclic nucleotide-binding domain-containing protein, partial [Anaerolineales bacterium]|nr:cyclic nucleotide-binding domain-containing protein [Anaerolineales bacterium]